MDKIELKIITPKKIVYQQAINGFYTYTTNGRIGILKNHAPITCVLEIGVTKILTDEEPVYITTMGGILHFKDNTAVILTDIAELGEDIDELRAKEALERAKARLEAKSENLNVIRAQIALKKAIARISARKKQIW